MDIKITKLKYEPSDKIVTQAEWEATVFEREQVPDALDEEGNFICAGPEIIPYIERTTGVTTFNAQTADGKGFIPYEDLTEEDVIGWLNLPDDLENILLERLEKQKISTVVEKKPWE